MANCVRRLSYIFLHLSFFSRVIIILSFAFHVFFFFFFSSFPFNSLPTKHFKEVKVLPQTCLILHFQLSSLFLSSVYCIMFFHRFPSFNFPRACYHFTSSHLFLDLSLFLSVPRLFLSFYTLLFLYPVLFIYSCYLLHYP